MDEHIRQSERTIRATPLRGLTLVEILVAVAILIVLFSVVVVTGKMTQDSRKGATARQQMAQVAAAINQYAAYWPAWAVAGIRHADKGWPDYIAGRLFPTPLYANMQGFNDYLDLTLPTPGADNLLNANECLFYCLSSAAGKGPYLRKEGCDDIHLATTANGQPLFYPANGTSGSEVRQRILDPWGTPLRYFWVYRDTNAFRGYLPVLTADPAQVALFKKAEGFVLESAGPDKKFGNVWQLSGSVTAQDISEASDNLTNSP